MLDNVRLWDWRAFHDTLSQSQPLRPYTYADTDVDRYPIDGKLRQVLLAPRELDLNQLGDARNSWINASFRLHARLRTGAGRGQPHHARGLARAAGQGRARQGAARPASRSPGPRSITARSRMNRYSCARSSRSSTIRRIDRGQRRQLRRRGRIPHRVVAAADWSPPIAEGDWNILLTDAAHAGQPHDDPPPRAGPAAARWPSSSPGTRTRTW